MSRARDFADLAGSADAGGLTGKNMVINGNMTISQRATSATDTGGQSVYRTLDRLVLWEATDGAFSSEQSTEAPDGFSHSVKLACTTADTSLAAGQYACFGQNIEAQNLQHLVYGTNAARTITVSFYVRSNKTGTYCLCVDKHDSTSYKFVKEFTINSADTWERKTITVEPDSQIKASAGAIDNNNGIGIRFILGLAWGSTYAAATDNVWSSDGNAFATSNQVNWMDSTSNNFYFTGFQVEIGDKATPFDHSRSYADEFTKCQRYYFESGSQYHYHGSDNDGRHKHFELPTHMRTSPTITTSSLPSGMSFNRSRPTFVTFVNATAGGDVSFEADAEL